ncbi:hypothetical protein BigBertha_44 [Bacillus phage BigBertha]|uniref:Uncharacterized protein n=1 Tax=Bacillus phage BigBertha TaxID=1406781 RepID=U5PVG2_9CAUD|nr:hypothetical protein BigBertha_44 [Bacillus phage BigBertha]AGY46552.1 hypothetical protein BigBertha_44 [Bacillus phage BigBertha]
MRGMVNALYGAGFTFIGFGMFGTGNNVAGVLSFLGAMYAINQMMGAKNNE